MAVPQYGVIVDEEYSATHKRQRLTIWSGAFRDVLEGAALSRPRGWGFIVETYNGDRVPVACPSPRDDTNYEEVDAAIDAALRDHHWERGDRTLSEALTGVPLADQTEGAS